MLQVSALRNVLVVGDPSAAGPVDLSAASALVRIGKRLYVVADDENRPGSLTYADDLVILCRKGRAEEALQQMRDLMGKLKLTVNEEKTRICKVPEGASTSWATRSGGCTRRRPARPVWAYGRRRRASGA